MSILKVGAERGPGGGGGTALHSSSPGVHSFHRQGIDFTFRLVISTSWIPLSLAQYPTTRHFSGHRSETHALPRTHYYLEVMIGFYTIIPLPPLRSRGLPRRSSELTPWAQALAPGPPASLVQAPSLTCETPCGSLMLQLCAISRFSGKHPNLSVRSCWKRFLQNTTRRQDSVAKVLGRHHWKLVRKANSF